jgi:hypothetical protein
MSLMLGVEVTAPPPIMADDKLKRFNVHDAFHHDCFENHIPVDPLIPAPVAASPVLIPLIPAPETQTLFLPVMTNLPHSRGGVPTSDQRAGEVKTAWQAKPKLDSSKMMNIWAQKLGWTSKDSTLPLVATPPARVLAAFDSAYIDVPYLVGVQA